MTKVEALAMLDLAPTGNHPSQINPTITCDHAIAIMRKAVEAGALETGGARAERIAKNVRKVCQWS